MILRDEAKKSAQKSSEEAAIDVKLTVNLHFSSINCSGDNLCFIDPFQRYLKGKKWQINGVFENVLVGVLFWNSKFRESFEIFRKSVLQTVITVWYQCKKHTHLFTQHTNRSLLFCFVLLLFFLSIKIKTRFFTSTNAPATRWSS